MTTTNNGAITTPSQSVLIPSVTPKAGKTERLKAFFGFADENDEQEG